MASSSPSALLSIADIARLYGLAQTTVRTYNGQAAQRRRAGTSRRHDFPAPTSRIGNSPLFDAEQVQVWFDHRPGRGVGGGRPPKVRDTISGSDTPPEEAASCDPEPPRAPAQASR
ncbi:hypothetical protein [Mycolicibacterium sp.]|uniref:hypothetical protein n=1 Tax=Mycolicibacterium sp. TaxID=2320850 RepID=UPI00355D28CA